MVVAWGAKAIKEETPTGRTIGVQSRELGKAPINQRHIKTATAWGPLSSPAFGKRRLVPWNSFSVDDPANPRNAARFSLSAAIAIGGSATAVIFAMTWHAAANSAKRIDVTSKVP